MTVDDELAAWGEPPVRADEQALIAFLDEALQRRARGEEVNAEELAAAFPGLAREGSALLQAAVCVEEFVASVLERSGLEGVGLAPDDATQAYQRPPDAVPEGFPGPVPSGFRVRAFLGEGSFSQVWLADHLRLGIPVALKALHLQSSGQARTQALALLENEAQVLARLNHPNIVRVYGLEQAGENHHLVLQFVDGGSLQGRLEREGPLAWQAAARYVADVGEALAHVHAAGVVHRDVKPANMLWDRQRDEALLTDFGLAARLAQGGVVAGTPRYMAPEAFDGLGTPAGDVYGLAASLFALVTGRVPFGGETRSELLANVRRGLPEFDPLFAGVPESLERLIRAGLAAEPDRRPELRAFVTALRGALNQLLADSLLLPAAGCTPAAAPVELRLRVSRPDGSGGWAAVAATHPEPVRLLRNMEKVPPLPERVGVRTGDRVRIEVLADRDGFITVFNVGPTGQLNLLHPEPAALAAAVRAGLPLHVLDVAMTPPAGRERLFAVWSREPLHLSPEEFFRLAQHGGVSAPYRATRNMERVQESVRRLRREDWHAVVLELDHGGP
jgi:serine/threonine-protein kinase